MWNQSIEYCQKRKKPAKKATKSQDRPARRRKPRMRPGLGALSSDNAIAMEDLLDLAEIFGEARALLDLEAARPGQIDVEDAIDAAGTRGDDADLRRKLDRLLD